MQLTCYFLPFCLRKQHLMIFFNDYLFHTSLSSLWVNESHFQLAQRPGFTSIAHYCIIMSKTVSLFINSPSAGHKPFNKLFHSAVISTHDPMEKRVDGTFN